MVNFVLQPAHYVGGFILLTLIALVLCVLFVPSFRGARTKIINWYGVVGIGFVIPLLVEMTGYLNTLDWREYVSPEAAPWVLLGIGLLQIYLRHRTDSPPKTMTEAVRDATGMNSNPPLDGT